MKNLIATLLVTMQLQSAFAVCSSQNILWVVDNSASMEKSRQALSHSMKGFLNRLKDRGVSEYQMAITSTDYFSQEGKLVSSGALNSVSANSSSPQTDFDTLIGAIQDSPTSFWEQGLESAREALLNQASFLVKRDVPLSVIFVSDENDYSCEAQCFGVEPENNTQWVPYPMARYTKFFHALKKSAGVPVSIFSIVGMDASPCAVASRGERYEDLVTHLGSGFSASICEAELGKNILSIADEIGN